MKTLGLIKSCNSSLTQSSREFEKSALDRQQVLSRTDFSAQPTNLTQDTRIAYAKNTESSEKIKLKKTIKKFLLLFAFAKSRIPLTLKLQFIKRGKFAEFITKRRRICAIVGII